MAEWYYSKGGNQAGPVTSQQLRQLVASGELQPTDHVWKDGMAAWVPVSAVSGLSTAVPVDGAQAPAAAVAPEQRGSNPAAQPSPLAQLAYATPASMSGSVMATGRSLEMLRQTKPWVRLISIVLLIAAGLMVVVGLISAATSGLGPPRNFVPMGVMVFAACMYGASAYYLSQYASAIGRVLKTHRESDLELALGAQKSFWKFSGILTLIAIALYAVVFVIAISIGSMRFLR